METIIITALLDDVVVELNITPSEWQDLAEGRAAVVDDVVVMADDNGDLVAENWSWDSDDLMVID